jgi:hypothetical protein
MSEAEFLRHGLERVHLEFFAGSQKNLIYSDLGQIHRRLAGRRLVFMSVERAVRTVFR